MTLEIRMRWLTLAGLSLLWTYLCIVFLFRQTVAGVVLRGRYLAPILLAGYVLIFCGIRWLESRNRLSEGRQKDIIVTALAVLLSLLAADTIYTTYSNANNAIPSPAAFAYERVTDPNLWHGELHPRMYYPTEQNFSLHKPDVRISAETYGEFYDTRMLSSPTLVDSVLQLRHLVYSIDNHGFRNTSPMEKARVFALGDSFVFGYSTAEGGIWIDHLERIIGQQVYNLGVSATGPGVQIQLLDHLLRSSRAMGEVEHILWMIFEGNDLENSYAPNHPVPEGERSVPARVVGTILDPFLVATATIRDRSVIAKLLDGDLVLRRWTSGGADSPYVVDGVTLEFPLYYSSKWGYRLFNPQDIDRAMKDETYILAHPNRPKLESSFGRMKALGEEFGFRVTLLIAPSAARMYGSDFESFPPLSDEPHFIRYVATLAERSGFDVVDMLELMGPHAEQELLYYRDDHHWNERGNEVAAEVIASATQF